MRRRFTPLTILALLALLLGGPTLTAAQQGTAPAGAQSGVSGSSYTSPSYGYRLTWDETWKVENDMSKNGRDSLELSNGTSSIEFDGYAGDGGDAQRCVQSAHGSLTQTSQVSDVTAAQDQQGKPLAGGDASDAFAVYNFTFTSNSGTTSAAAAYIECHALGQGALLRVTQLVAQDAYNDQIAARSALLARVKFPGGAAATVPSATAVVSGTASASGTTPAFTLPGQATATATAPAAATASIAGTARSGQTGVRGATYISPTYGYTLHWTSVWRTESDQEKVNQGNDHFDQVVLTNGTALVFIQGYAGFNGNGKTCLQGNLDNLRSQGVKLTAHRDASGKTIAGTTKAGATYAAYDFTVTNSQTNAPEHLTYYVECRSLVPGRAVLFVEVVVPQAKYTAQMTQVQTLLSALRLPKTTSPATAPVATVSSLFPPATAPGTAVAGTAAAGTAQTGAQVGVTGSSYRSPTYGYRLSWDNTWKVDQATSQNGTDLLELDNGTSFIGFQGTVGAGGNAQTCVQNSENGLKSAQGFGDVRAAKGSNGKPLAGGDARNAFAVYDFTLKNSDGSTTASTAYVECYALGHGAVLRITQFVAAADYNAQISARAALLNRLKLPGGAATAPATAPATATTAAPGLFLPHLPQTTGPAPTATAGR